MITRRGLFRRGAALAAAVSLFPLAIKEAEAASAVETVDRKALVAQIRVGVLEARDFMDRSQERIASAWERAFFEGTETVDVTETLGLRGRVVASSTVGFHGPAACGPCEHAPKEIINGWIKDLQQGGVLGDD